MDKTPRLPTTDAERRVAEAVARPVLARLPDVTSDLPTARTAAQLSAVKAGYRFDPPQNSGARTVGPEHLDMRNANPAQPKTPQNSRSSQPHIFDRGRSANRPASAPRRKSPILPQSNPFELPRRRLVDSITPLLRFVTLVALFTAAGTWVQVVGLHSRPTNESMESPKTAAQQPMSSSTTKTVDRPTKSPTATGPAGTTPESGTRVGRVHESNDFAAIHDSFKRANPTLGGPFIAIPGLVGANGGALPQVQTKELPDAGVGDDPARDRMKAPSINVERAPEIARLPGFILETPSR